MSALSSTQLEISPALLAKLSQLTDSALPIGNFAFSNGLESAIQSGVVNSADDLSSYTHMILRQTANMDGIALIHAHRLAINADLDLQSLINVDAELWCRRVGHEQQLMVKRMGKKFAELALTLVESQLISKWLSLIKQEQTHGCLAVTQALIFAELGADEQTTFSLYQYGAASMVLNAAIRLMKIDHFTTQKILFNANQNVALDYQQIALKNLTDMSSFAPIFDVLVGHHTQAHVRLFMN